MPRSNVFPQCCTSHTTYLTLFSEFRTSKMDSGTQADRNHVYLQQCLAHFFIHCRTHWILSETDTEFMGMASSQPLFLWFNLEWKEIFIITVIWKQIFWASRISLNIPAINWKQYYKISMCEGVFPPPEYLFTFQKEPATFLTLQLSFSPTHRCMTT